MGFVERDGTDPTDRSDYLSGPRFVCPTNHTSYVEGCGIRNLI